MHTRLLEPRAFGAGPTFHRQEVMKESPPAGDSCSGLDMIRHPVLNPSLVPHLLPALIRRALRCNTAKVTCVPFPERTILHLLEGNLLQQADADQGSSASVHGVRQRGRPAHKGPIRVRDTQQRFLKTSTKEEP